MKNKKTSLISKHNVIYKKREPVASVIKKFMRVPDKRTTTGSQPVQLNKYPTRTKAEMKLIDKRPFGDRDRDRVPNYFDCKPLVRWLQGSVVLYHGTTRQAAEKIKKEGLKRYYGINPVVYLTPKKEVAYRYSGDGIVFEVKLPEKTVKKYTGGEKPLPTQVMISEDISPKKVRPLKEEEYPKKIKKTKWDM